MIVRKGNIILWKEVDTVNALKLDSNYNDGTEHSPAHTLSGLQTEIF